MYEVHQPEFNLAASFVRNAEVVPLRTTFGIDIVLHVELVGWELLMGIVHGKEEIAALKTAVKGQPVRLRFARGDVQYFGQMLQNRFIQTAHLLLLPVEKDTTKHAISLLTQTVHLAVVNSSVDLHSTVEQCQHFLVSLLHLFRRLHFFLLAEGKGDIFGLIEALARR
jgi:hypothetical protein